MRTTRRVAVLASLFISLTWVALALAATPQGGTFSGGTSQNGGKVGFTVPAGGGSVLNFEATLTATCKKQGQPNETMVVNLTPTPSIAVVEGVFSYSSGFSFYTESKPMGHGHGTVSGSFDSAGSASGSMSFPWNFSAGPLRGYRCDTGTVAFHASVPAPGASPVGAAGCVVPRLKGRKLAMAGRAIRSAGCRAGKIIHRHSRQVASHRVLAQKPRPGTQMKAGSTVRLIVSSGHSR